MHGPYRIPTLLGAVDRACREGLRASSGGLGLIKRPGNDPAPRGVDAASGEARLIRGSGSPPFGERGAVEDESGIIGGVGGNAALGPLPAK